MWLFFWLACYVLLMLFFFHKSGATNLSSVIEQVPCYWCNGSLMEMHITLCEDGWWGISTPLMKGGLRTWISRGFMGGKGHIFGAKFFLCHVDVFSIECIEHEQLKLLGENAPNVGFEISFFSRILFCHDFRRK
jgi:hypothetical protein